METEDPFEREEGASAPIPPPPRNVILSDPLDAAGPADGQDSADPADAHAADTADTAAPTFCSSPTMTRSNVRRGNDGAEVGLSDIALR